MFYSRSSIVPDLKLGADLPAEAKSLLQNHFFHLDVVYLHSKPSKDNKTQQVFDFFTDVEQLSPKDHLLYVSESSTKQRLNSQVAQLVAHPRLRGAQLAWTLPQLDKVEEAKKK